MVAISSKEHMVQGEPAFARINKMGQTNMEIFNCTNHTMTIEKNSVFGTIVNLEQKEMNQSVNIIEENQFKRIKFSYPGMRKQGVLGNLSG